MSGYLQRLVRAVTHPAETIRPILGSVYSAPEPVKEHAALPQHEEIASIGHSQSPASSPSQRAQEDPELPSQLAPLIPRVQSATGTLLSSTTQSSSPKTDFSEAASFQPLLPPVKAEESEIDESKSEHTTVVEIEKKDMASVRRYSPLMTEVMVRSIHPAMPSPRANRIASAAVRREFSHRAEPEPDDIQIHIGRIEVTAVQQAPTRPALKPVRKGQSLDEYLKHRDRRA